MNRASRDRPTVKCRTRATLEAADESHKMSHNLWLICHFSRGINFSFYRLKCNQSVDISNQLVGSLVRMTAGDHFGPCPLICPPTQSDLGNQVEEIQKTNKILIKIICHAEGSKEGLNQSNHLESGGGGGYKKVQFAL